VRIRKVAGWEQGRRMEAKHGSRNGSNNGSQNGKNNGSQNGSRKGRPALGRCQMVWAMRLSVLL
jgi:flagellar biosynthesis/type III secretory pathway protein FliH